MTHNEPAQNPTNDFSLNQTVLFNLHQSLDAKLVPFAGYSMPVNYPLGIKHEHLHVRTKAGLFDVSHMGQIRLKGKHAASALERLVPVDIIDLAVGAQRYALFTNEQGGVLDDFMVTNAGDFLFLVVNASRKKDDIAHLKLHLQEQCEIEVLEDHALLALQGPMAVSVLAKIAPEIESMTFMSAKTVVINGVECFVSRSGYTGEDGFEISLPNSHAEALVKRLLTDENVEMIGLGARDSLRLEAGLCLYGHELTPDISPVEAGLLWALSKSRRADGARAGGYIGADKLMGHIVNGVERKRVGLKPQGRMPVREGAELVDERNQTVGYVSSGGFGVSLNAPIAMGFLNIEIAKEGTMVNAIVRGKAVPMDVVKLPFIKPNYRRN